jgi:hypothetical protein
METQPTTADAGLQSPHSAVLAHGEGGAWGSSDGSRAQQAAFEEVAGGNLGGCVGPTFRESSQILAETQLLHGRGSTPADFSRSVQRPGCVMNLITLGNSVLGYIVGYRDPDNLPLDGARLKALPDGRVGLRDLLHVTDAGKCYGQVMELFFPTFSTSRY